MKLYWPYRRNRKKTAIQRTQLGWRTPACRLQHRHNFRKKPAWLALIFREAVPSVSKYRDMLGRSRPTVEERKPTVTKVFKQQMREFVNSSRIIRLPVIWFLLMRYYQSKGFSFRYINTFASICLAIIPLANGH